MPTANPKVVVLLPTYNERDNLAQVVSAVLAVSPGSHTTNVWILDDASPDGTGELADELARADPRVRVTHRAAKQGLGPAYLDGFRRALAAGYDLIVEMDADLSHPPEYLPRLIDTAREYDVVVGSRWVSGGDTAAWPWYRKAISRGGSWYARTVLGLPIRDLTAGFKCFRRAVLERIDLDRVESTGYAFQVEMTYRAVKAGFSVVEVPILFVERTAGSSKMSPSIALEAMWRVPLLRWRVR